jgi:3-oxoacyl-[acyl-carrier-protein] synthase-3
MEAEGIAADGIDALFLHQANGFMNEKIARKLKFSDKKVPSTLEFYGNTGSASIPLTMAHHFSGNAALGKQRCLLSGFGVGLSWGVVAATLDGVYSPLVREVG